MIARDLEQQGLKPARIFANLSAAELVEHALQRDEGKLSDRGSLVALTGERTARSPEDKYIVRDASVEKEIDWGKVNRPLSPEIFERLLERAREFIQDKPLYVQDAYACADPRYRLRLRVVAEFAWHTLFSQCLFRKLTANELTNFDPEWTILALPTLEFDAKEYGLRTSTAIAVSFEKKIILIAGTQYAGEIKKSIFTILNALLPFQGVLSMHCSANIGAEGDTALFFGLSGTGKTTLSADPNRRLIGDDEHGWSNRGVFNIEGGCYAKTIRLSPAKEPQIYEAIRFGSVLENVPFLTGSREPDYESQQYTENTRAAYPLEFIPNYEPTGMGGQPKNIFFLTCDAFGVLPPISRLSPEQAMEHFLCGYTAKVAGTELGVKEPKETFSTCFGAPFLPLAPKRYAELLRDRLEEHQVPVWLINTGWAGGAYGVGQRIDLTYTRAMLQAALSGELTKVATRPDPIFGVSVPTSCPGVPSSLLDPRESWNDKAAYDRAAEGLAERFRATFSQYQ